MHDLRDPSHRPDIWHTLRYASAQLDRIREANGGAAVLAAAAAAAEMSSRQQHQHHQQQQVQQQREITARERALWREHGMKARSAARKAGRGQQQSQRDIINADENSSVGSNVGHGKVSVYADGEIHKANHAHCVATGQSSRYDGDEVDYEDSSDDYMDSRSYEDSEMYEDDDDDDDDDDIVARCSPSRQRVTKECDHDDRNVEKGIALETGP